MTERERMSDQELSNLRTLAELNPMGAEIRLLATIDVLKAEVREKDERIESLMADGRRFTEEFISGIKRLEAEVARLRGALVEIAREMQRPAEPLDSCLQTIRIVNAALEAELRAEAADSAPRAASAAEASAPDSSPPAR